MIDGKIKFNAGKFHYKFLLPINICNDNHGKPIVFLKGTCLLNIGATYWTKHMMTKFL
jgi:hypothetical protein